MHPYLFFLLLTREYTKHPPSATNTRPMIIISTIPISHPPFPSILLMLIPDSTKKSDHNKYDGNNRPNVYIHFDFLLTPFSIQNTSTPVRPVTVDLRFFSIHLAFS